MSATIERWAQELNLIVGLLLAMGATHEEIATRLGRDAEERKLPVAIKVVEPLPGKKAISITFKQPAEAPAPAVASTSECSGPHIHCPVCKEEALCLAPVLMAIARVTLDEVPPQGGCPNCGSFLVLERSADPWTFRLMTDDEVAGLSDDLRNKLLRGRRRVEHRNAATKTL